MKDETPFKSIGKLNIPNDISSDMKWLYRRYKQKLK